MAETTSQLIQVNSDGSFTSPTGFKWDGAGNTVATSYAQVPVAVGNTGATTTLSFPKGLIQRATLTANCTFTFTAPTYDGALILLELTQDGTGSRTVTWPSTVIWGGASAPTLTTTAAAVDSILLSWNAVTGKYHDIAIKLNHAS